MKKVSENRLIKLIIPVAILATTTLFFSFRNNTVAQTASDCWAVTSQQWGTRCTGTDGFEVKLRNDCTEAKDIKGCVQATDGTWNCLTHSNVKTGETATFYNCKSNGRYIYWTRKAGDQDVEFPTSKEVEDKY